MCKGVGIQLEAFCSVFFEYFFDERACLICQWVEWTQCHDTVLGFPAVAATMNDGAGGHHGDPTSAGGHGDHGFGGC